MEQIVSGSDHEHPLGPPSPIDPELRAAAQALSAALPPGSVSPESIPTLRGGNGVILAPSDDELSRGGRFRLELRLVPSLGTSSGPGASEPAVASVPVLVCRPTRGESAAVVVYLHGGGMIAGDARNGVEEILDWATELSLTVVSVDYRLAPEAPHPAPVEDCFAGVRWAIENAKELGCPSGRVIVAGASAGGGLAAGVALLAREQAGSAPSEHEVPLTALSPLTGVVLMAPMLDDRNNSVSAHQFTGVGIWDRHDNETGWSALLGERRGTPGLSPIAAPARAVDLAGLPPFFIDVGTAETFRDEAVAFAGAVWRAGGEAELHAWSGGFHGFTAYAPDAAITRSALEARVKWIRRLLARPASAAANPTS